MGFGIGEARKLWKSIRTFSWSTRSEDPLEVDPVGEFLARKEAGITALDEPDTEQQALPGEESGEATQAESEYALEAPQENDSIESQAFAGEFPDLPEAGSEAYEEPEEEAEETEEERESKTMTTTSQAQVETTPPDQHARKLREVHPGEETEVKELLEIFKSEPLFESPISILSRGLEDTNVYTLLEQTREIARKFKRSHKSP